MAWTMIGRCIFSKTWMRSGAETTTSTASITGNGNRTVEAWIYNPVVAVEETIFSWAHRGGPDGTAVAFSHGSHDAFGAVGHWGNGPDLGWDSIETADDSRTTGDDQEEEGVWTYVAYVYDSLHNTTLVYTNGHLTRSDQNGPLNAHNGNLFVLGAQNEIDGLTRSIPGSMTVAKLNVYSDALSGTIITRQYDLNAPAFGRARINIVDGDNDLMDDDWEKQFFGDTFVVSDASLDKDEDGLSNGEEHALRLERRNGFVFNPNNSDSDGDDVSDGAEIERMVLGQPAPTDALDPDSDDDGLNDGEERDLLTNPLNSGSDGDGFPDKVEIDANSDPNLSSSIPAIPVPAAKHRYSFSETGGAGTTLIDSINAQNGTIIDGGINDSVAGNGVVLMAGGTKDTSDYPQFPSGLISGAGASGDAGDMTIEIWATQHSVQNWARVFDFGASTTNYVLLSWVRDSALNQNQFRFFNDPGNIAVNDFSAPNTLNEEVHYAVVLDDDGGNTGNTGIKIYKNGLPVSSLSTDLDISALQDTNVWLGRSQYNDGTANASYNEFRIYDVALSGLEVLSSFKKGADSALTMADFRITHLDYDSNAKELTITFISPAGMNYRIEENVDGAGWIPFEGGLTTDISTVYSEISVPNGVETYLIRVRNLDFVAP